MLSVPSLKTALPQPGTGVGGIVLLQIGKPDNGEKCLSASVAWVKRCADYWHSNPSLVGYLHNGTGDRRRSGRQGTGVVESGDRGDARVGHLAGAELRDDVPHPQTGRGRIGKVACRRYVIIAGPIMPDAGNRRSGRAGQVGVILEAQKAPIVSHRSFFLSMSPGRAASADVP